jgi:hypothetical protein
MEIQIQKELLESKIQPNDEKTCTIRFINDIPSQFYDYIIS